MSWFLRKTSVAAPQPETNSSALSTKDRLQRVNQDDIVGVTREDVERIKRTLTDGELRTAMETMLEENKFADVLVRASPSAWEAAARGVRPIQAQVFTGMVKDRMILLFNVLPYLSEDFLEMMERSFSSCYGPSL